MTVSYADAKTEVEGLVERFARNLEGTQTHQRVQHNGNPKTNNLCYNSPVRNRQTCIILCPIGVTSVQPAVY